MALSIPIISEFDGKGISKAIAEFKQLETVGEKAQFAIKKAAIPAAAAIGALTGALGLAAKAAAEDEQQQAVLAKTMQNVVSATDATVMATEDMIGAMSRATGTADSELRPAFSALLLGTKNVGEATSALALSQDIATGTGLDLGNVADALSKALAGNMKGLRALSPEMAGMIKDGSSLDEVMLALSDNFGGAAANSAKTAAGQFKILKNSLAETQESIGKGLLPIVEKVLPVLQKMADWAQKNPKAFLLVASTIGAIATSILAVNFAMAANPFTLIAVGIGLLITGLAVAYTKFEGFRNVVNFVLNSLISGFETMANAYIALINIIISGINLIKPGADIGKIGSVDLPTIGGGSGGATSGGQAREGGLNNILPNLPTTPVLDPIVTIPRGGGPPSLIDPTPGGGGGGVGGGGNEQTIQVNVTGGLSTSAEIGQAVVNAIRAYNRSAGPAQIQVA